jgi:alpha-glucuronidase
VHVNELSGNMQRQIANVKTCAEIGRTYKQYWNAESSGLLCSFKNFGGGFVATQRINRNGQHKFARDKLSDVDGDATLVPTAVTAHGVRQL